MKHLSIYKAIAYVIATALVAVSLASAYAFVAHAAINKQVNYQGKLTNSSNVAVADGLYTMEFKLYDALTGGNTLWTETDSGSNKIQVTNGLFSVMLGSTTPFTGVDFNQTLYLGVKIESDAEMAPRKVLGTVPAAFVSDTVDNISSEQFLRADAQNSTSTSSTFLTFVQNGAGKIAEFFGAAGSSVLSLLSSGNVGIGTTSPYAKLSVDGRGVFNQDVRANYFTSTSTSVASTFPYASTTALTVSGTNGLQLASGLNGPLQAVNGLVSASSTLSINYGGTGLSAKPTYGQLLLGNAAGGYTLTATSSLGLTYTDSNVNAFIHASTTIPKTYTANVFTDTNTFSAASTFNALATFNGSIFADVNDFSNGLVIYDAPDAETPFQIDGDSKLVLFAKENLGYKVGIGTTSPYTLLSVAGETASTYFTGSSLTATSSFPNIRFGEVVITHKDGSVTSRTATTTTDLGRGSVLLAAVASAQDGDTIQLSSGTFDIGDSTLDLNGSTNVKSISLIGSGKYSTTIMGSSTNTIVRLAPRARVADFSVVAVGNDTLLSSQVPIGTNESVDGALIENVYINGKSDGIFLSGLTGTTTIKNVTIDSYFDAIMSSPQVGETTVVNIYDSVIRIKDGSSTITRGIIARGNTTVNSFNNQVYLYDTDATTRYAYVADKSNDIGGILNIYGGLASSTSGTYDLAAINTGVLTVNAATKYDPAKITGAVAYSDNAQIRYSLGSSGASSTILWNNNGVANWVATSSLGIGFSSITGTLGVAQGGTGAPSFGQGWVYSPGGTTALAASTSPTVNFIFATSTTQRSTFVAGIATRGSSALYNPINESTLLLNTYAGSSLTSTDGIIDIGDESIDQTMRFISTFGGQIGASISPVDSYFSAGSGGGKVGVGTNNPQSLVHMFGSSPELRIEGTTDDFERVSFYDDTNLASYIGNNQGDGSLHLWTGGNNSIKFFTGGGTVNPRMSIDLYGNVGIGDYNPTAKLSVAGQVNADYFTATSTTATSTFAYDVSVSGMLNVIQPSTGAVVVGDTTGNARGTTALDIQSGRTAANKVASNSNSVAVGYDNQASGLNAIALGSSNTSSGSNSVTVGISNSGSATSISTAFGRSNTASGNSSTAFGYNNTSSNTDASAFGRSNTASGNTSSAFGYSNTASVTNASVFGSSITNTIANSTMLGPSDSAKLTILSTGEVKGSFFTATSTTASTLRYASSTALTVSGGLYNSALTSGRVVYSTTGGRLTDNSFMTVSGSMLVLDANSSSGVLNIKNTSAGSNSGFIGVNNSVSPFIAGLTTGDFGFKSDFGDMAFSANNGASANLLIKNATGNVGIGTTSPYAKLSVVGPVVAEYFTATSTTATSTFAGGFTTGALGLTAFANGNVGIGTTSPFSSFAVSGNPIPGMSSSVSTFSVYGGTGVVSGANAGAGGGILLSTGNGTAASTGATGGDFRVLTGTGASGGTAGRGGNVSFNLGNGGNAGASGGVGGGFSVVAGAGGTGNGPAAGVGGAITLTAGAGGAQSLSSTNADGGAITLTSGAAGSVASGGANGGNILLLPGTGSGTGSSGKIGIGTSTPWRTLSVYGSSDLGINALAGYFTSTSTTASTFPYASSTALTVSGTNGLQLASSLSGSLQAINGLVSATSTLSTAFGGTGISTKPAYGQLLLGQANGTYALTSTSSLGLLGSSSIGSGTQGQIPFYNAAGNTLTATSSLFIAQSGNVGVGNASPINKFSVQNPGQLTVDFQDISASQGLAFYINSFSAGLSGMFASENDGLIAGFDSNIQRYRYGGGGVYVDGSSEYVGIGTNNPLSRIHALDGTVAELKFNSGGAALTPTLALGNTDVGGKFGALVAGTNGSGFYFDDTGFFDIVAAPKADYTGNVLGINGTGVVRVMANGNVGIGNTAPAKTLEIGGENSMAGALRLTEPVNGFYSDIYTAADDAYMVITPGGNGLVVGADLLPGSKLSVNGNQAIGSAYAAFGAPANGLIVEGNVGIGTTSPYARLSVAGQVVGQYFTSTSTTASTFPYASSTALTVSGTNGLQLASSLSGSLQAINGLVSATSTLSTAFGGTGISTKPAYGQLLLGQANGTYALTSTSSLGLLGSSSIGSGTQGQIPFYNAAGNTLTATSSLFIAQSGNVGVGTSTTDQKLQVSGNISLGRRAQSAITRYVGLTDIDGGFKNISGSGTAGMYIDQAANGDTSLGFRTGTWGVSEDTRLSIGSGGDVSIQSNKMFKFGDTNGFSWTKFDDQDSYNLGLTSVNLYAASTDGNAATHAFVNGEEAAGTANVVLPIDGSNLGIGKVSPSYPIDVYSSNSTAVRIQGSASSAANWQGRIIAGGQSVAFLMGERNDQAWLGAHNAALNAWSDFYLNPDGGNKLYLGSQDAGGEAVEPVVTITNASGNSARVGIGNNTSPSAKLHVIATTEQLRLGYDASNYWSSTVGSTGATAFDAIGTGANFSFADNVGIGTSTPYSMLSVAGTVVGKNFVATSSTASILPYASSTALTVSGGLYNSALTSGRVVYSTTGGRLTDNSFMTVSGSMLVLDANSSSGVLNIKNTSAGSNSGFIGVNNSVSPFIAGLTTGDFGFKSDFGDMAFSANNGVSANLLIKNATGNVGIGTTSPYAKLSVVGPVVAEYFTATSTTATSTFVGSLVANTGGGRFGLGTANPLAPFHMQIASLASGQELARFQGGRGQYFELHDDTIQARTTGGAVSAFYFNYEGGNTIFNGLSGSVGIGELSPNVSTKLAVSGGTVIGSGYDTLAAPTNGLIVEGNLGIGTSTPYAKLSVVGEVVAPYYTATSTTATSTFAGGFRAAGASGLNVLQNGKVGIGTASPAYTLDLSVNNTASDGARFSNTNGSTVIIMNRIAAGVNGAFRYQTAGTDYWDFGLPNNGTNDLRLVDDQNNIARLYIKRDSSGGFIGMGTTTPTAKLHIQPENAAYVPLKVTGFVGQTANLQEWQSVANTALSVVTASGSIGAGTSTPYAKLAVQNTSVSEIPFAVYGTLNQTANLVDVGVGSTTVFSLNRGSNSKTTLNLGSYNRPTGYSQISTDVDSSYENGQELNIRVNTFGSGGRIRFGGITTAGVETSAYSMNFADIQNWESVPSSIKQTATAVGDMCPTGLCSFVGNDTGGDFVIGYGAGGGNYITNPQAGDKSPGLSFKSYLSTLSTYAANTPSAFRYNTATTSAGLGTKLHTLWETNDIDLMALTGSGNLGIGTSTPYAKLSVVGEVVAPYYTATSTTATSTFAGGFRAAGASGLNVLQNGKVGIGTASPVARLQIDYNNIDYTNTNGENSHVILNNPNASGQNVISSVINGQVVAKWRTDQVGNISWVAGTTGAHAFYTGGDYGVGANRFNIANDGTITTGNGSYLDDGIGNINGAADVCSQSSGYCLSNFSDIRLKKDVQALGNTLDKVLQLNPITYKWNDAYLDTHKGLEGATSTKIGFIAQDVQQLFPDIITQDRKTGYIGVDYPKFSAILAQAIKETNSRIDLVASTTNILTCTDVQCISPVIQSLKNRVQEISVTVAQNTQDIQDLKAQMEALRAAAASTTASVVVASTTEEIASSTKALIAADSSFVARIAAAVKDMLQGMGEWTMDKLTARIVYTERVEAQVAAISKGLEMTDAATGQIYCVQISNGDWLRRLGSCATAASSTPAIQQPPAYTPPVVPPTIGDTGSGTTTPSGSGEPAASSTPSVGGDSGAAIGTSTPPTIGGSEGTNPPQIDGGGSGTTGTPSEPSVSTNPPETTTSGGADGGQGSGAPAPEPSPAPAPEASPSSGGDSPAI